MKILHINDIAGVAAILVKYLRKAGHEADLISFMDDKEFGFCEFYKGKRFQNLAIMLSVLRGRIPQYDIIHLHFDSTGDILRWLYKFNKPIVRHYHGSDIAMNSMQHRLMDYNCKAILVAGEQLLQYHPRAQYLPTVVDTEHFYPMESNPTGQTLIFDIPYLDTQRAIQESGITDVTVIDRANSCINYADLPITLNTFYRFIDTRYHKPRGLLTDMSKTGLEALACGLDVYHINEWKHGLPERHQPENVVKQLIGYYEVILN